MQFSVLQYRGLRFVPRSFSTTGMRGMLLGFRRYRRTFVSGEANEDNLRRAGCLPKGKTLDTDYSKASTVAGVSNCGWSPDQVFMLCDQALMAEGKPDRELSVFVYHSAHASFHFFGLSESGGQPHTTELVISPDGNHREYQSKSEIKGNTVRFHTINEFRTPDYVEWWSEYSTDAGQHRTKNGRGKREKQSRGGRAWRETRLDWFR